MESGGWSVSRSGVSYFSRLSFHHRNSPLTPVLPHIGCLIASCSQLHSPRIERASVWADRESYLSLVEGACTLIRPKVQPCGWKCYVRTDYRDSHFNESHKRLYSAFVVLCFEIPPLNTPQISRIILALSQTFAFNYGASSAGSDFVVQRRFSVGSASCF